MSATKPFVRRHNTGRSQMAEAYLRHFMGSTVEVASAGTIAADEADPGVLKLLTPSALESADYIITMGCDVEGVPHIDADWGLPDPKGESPERLREIRDSIKAKTLDLAGGAPPFDIARTCVFLGARWGNREVRRNRPTVKLLEAVFERLLWNSRLVIIIAVVASMIVAFVMFYVATADVVSLLRDVSHYVGVAENVRGRLHASIVAQVAEIVDGYLFATIMIIFSLGLYELFISKIDVAERSPIAPRLLLIRTLDDLKERLAKVVFLILIVRYFEYALQAPIEKPLDLLFLAVGIALVAAALYLSSRGAHAGSESRKPDETT